MRALERMRMCHHDKSGKVMRFGAKWNKLTGYLFLFNARAFSAVSLTVQLARSRIGTTIYDWWSIGRFCTLLCISIWILTHIRSSVSTRTGGVEWAMEETRRYKCRALIMVSLFGSAKKSKMKKQRKYRRNCTAEKYECASWRQPF